MVKTLRIKKYFLACSFALFAFSFSSSCYALNLDNVKSAFINGDYKAAITEGEKLMAKTKKDYNLDELYYILALSYMKDGNLLRASDIFEIIINEFKKSRFTDEAKLGLADTYFLRGYYGQAIEQYKAILQADKNSRVKPLVYSRLSQCGAKTGDSRMLKEYQDKLKQEFPMNIEPVEPLVSNAADPSGIYYSVQVGAFSSVKNANNLKQKLTDNGYTVFIEEAGSADKVTYKVKVGKFCLRSDAEILEAKLSSQGYPTKIYP